MNLHMAVDKAQKHWLNWVCKGTGRQTLSPVLLEVARVLRPTAWIKKENMPGRLCGVHRTVSINAADTW